MMRFNTKAVILAVVALTAAGSLRAQDRAQERSGGQPAPSLKWDLRFDTKFDNREYDRVGYLAGVASETHFSTRVVPAVGIGFAGRHRVMAGLSYTYDMGVASARKPNPEGLFYYNYTTDEYGAWVGAFERRHLIGDYSRAMISGAQAFYDNVIDGFALQYMGRGGSGRTRLELVLDWDGEQSATERESFRVLSAGEFNPFTGDAWRWFTASYSLDVYHLATRADTPSDGVVDHVMADAYVGAALERVLPWFERLTVKAGWLGAFDRDRDAATGWMTPGGVTFDATVQKRRVGIRNFTYSGGALMPLYRTYGSRINRGDPFFTDSKFHNFTTLYWHPRLAGGMMLRFELGLPTDGRQVGWQQVAWIGISLDDNFFRKKR